MLKVISLLLLVVCFFSCEEDTITMVASDKLLYEAFYTQDFPNTYKRNFTYNKIGTELFLLNNIITKCKCRTDIVVDGVVNSTRGTSVISFSAGPLDSIKWTFWHLSNQHSLGSYLEFYYKSMVVYSGFSPLSCSFFINNSRSYEANVTSFDNSEKSELTKIIDFIVIDSISIQLPKKLVYKKYFGLTSIEFQDGVKLEWVRHAD